MTVGLQRLTQEQRASSPESSSIVPSSTFLQLVEGASGEKLSHCYQCKKCSSGCPVTFAMDYLPHTLLRMAQLGLKERVLSSTTVWICASCETCTTRCPNGIDIAGMMDAFRHMALEASAAGEIRLPEAVRDVPRLHSAFLGAIKADGRVHEISMLARFMFKANLFARLRSGRLLEEARLGWRLFTRGKLKLLPHRVRERNTVARLFERKAK